MKPVAIIVIGSLLTLFTGLTAVYSIMNHAAGPEIDTTPAPLERKPERPVIGWVRTGHTMTTGDGERYVDMGYVRDGTVKWRAVTKVPKETKLEPIPKIPDSIRKP